MKILDLSYCQTSVNWDSVKADSVDAVILRLGHGLKKDDMFDSHVAGAKYVGIPFGGYYYIESLDAAGAQKEAQHAIEVASPHSFTWPIYGDMEGDTMFGDINNVIKTFCDTIEAYGYKGGVYASLSNLRLFEWSTIASYSIWCAQYYDYCSFEHSVDLWQYTDEGRVSGINRTVDLNEGYKDFTTGTYVASSLSNDADGASEGFSITELQRTLNFLNYGTLTVDGLDGPNTQAAVRTAQAAYGITVDGIAGPLTWGYLSGQLSATQQKLVDLGYILSVDGRLGATGVETISAVKDFQSQHSLTVSGNVDYATFNLMFNSAVPETQTTIEVIADNTNTTTTDKYKEQMTEHWNRWEFVCECALDGGPGYCDGFPVDISPNLVEKLEAVRLEVGFALICSSGVRCEKLNAEVGGVSDSRHKLGKAADILVYSANGLSVSEFAAICRKHGLGTIEYESQSFVHCQVDVW